MFALACWYFHLHLVKGWHSSVSMATLRAMAGGPLLHLHEWLLHVASVADARHFEGLFAAAHHLEIRPRMRRKLRNMDVAAVCIRRAMHTPSARPWRTNSCTLVFWSSRALQIASRTLRVMRLATKTVSAHMTCPTWVVASVGKSG